MIPNIHTTRQVAAAATDMRVLTGQLHGKIGACDMVALQLSQCTYVPELPVQAFVPPEVYNVYKEKSIWFIDYRVLWTADALADYFNTTITLNTWHTGGRFKYRGFRPPACTDGALLSQHRAGRAADCDVIGVSPATVRAEVIAHPTALAFRFITCIEDKVNWFHFDCRNTGTDQLLIVQP